MTPNWSFSYKDLAPARDVLENSDKWYQSIQDLGQNVSPQTSYEELRDQVEALKVPETIEPDAKDRQNTVATTFVHVFKARNTLKTKRKEPVRKPGAWVQRYVSTFSQFLSNYHGVVEVIKGADEQFGGLAYGTLSLMLSVPVHKDEYERDIEEALDEFSYAFPRLQSLEEIYTDDSGNFKRLIARVYAEVVLFARECTTYYLKSSLGRIKSVMVNPPKTGVQTQIGEIRRLLSETRWETEVLLQRRIMLMRDENMQMRLQLEAVHEMQHQSQQAEAQRALSSLKQGLGIVDEDPHVDETRYKRLLDMTFSDYVSYCEDPCTMSWKRFSQDSEVAQFLSATSSRVLLVSGRSSDDVSNTTLSWISYGAILFSQGNRPECKCTVCGFFFCQTQPTLPEASRPQFKHVLARWVYQIVSSIGHLSHRRQENIIKLFSSSLWTTEIEEALKACADEFTGLMSELDEGAVVNLVLDRADQCRLDEDMEFYESNIDDIVDWLIKVAQRSPRVLKILVVSHMTAGVPAASRPRRKAALEKGVYAERLRWNQGI